MLNKGADACEGLRFFYFNAINPGPGKLTFG